MSMQQLIEKIQKTGNPSVVGLDARLAYIPQHIVQTNLKLYGETCKAAAESVLAFNKGLIDALYDIVPAVKPQSAYYELLGAEGAIALEQTITYAQQKGMYVIADIKRNDIGSTASAYAQAYLGKIQVGDTWVSAYHADSVTVNPYLGSDGITPFLEECKTHNKSMFVLVKTSNPSSGEFQNQKIGEKTLYELVAQQVHIWGKDLQTASGYTQVGAVVGATYPAEQKQLRAMLPHTYFLVPGYGAQGATAQDIAPAFHADGMGAIVNSSRGIMCAWQKTGNAGEDFAEASRTEALRMKEDICSAIGV